MLEFEEIELLRNELINLYEKLGIENGWKVSHPIEAYYITHKINDYVSKHQEAFTDDFISSTYLRALEHSNISEIIKKKLDEIIEFEYNRDYINGIRRKL